MTDINLRANWSNEARPSQVCARRIRVVNETGSLILLQDSLMVMFSHPFLSFDTFDTDVENILYLDFSHDLNVSSKDSLKKHTVCRGMQSKSFQRLKMNCWCAASRVLSPCVAASAHIHALISSDCTCSRSIPVGHIITPLLSPTAVKLTGLPVFALSPS